MEQTNCSACKFDLYTYEGDGNHYYDTTFNLRVQFRANSNGQYKVTFNEVMFKNNEETLIRGKDYILFKAWHYNGNVLECDTYTFTVKKNVFTYTVAGFGSVLEALSADAKFVEPSRDALPAAIDSLQIENGDGDKTFDGTGYAEFIFDPVVAITFKNTNRNIVKVTMEYSDNWAYVLNNMNRVIESEITEDKNTHYVTARFRFMNIRINGAYQYVLETPVTCTVNTLNANNEAYNIVGLSYNATQTHNSTIQMASSMECVTNDLSNFRVRLLNDQFDPVHLREPVYVQFTVSNEG